MAPICVLLTPCLFFQAHVSVPRLVSGSIRYPGSAWPISLQSTHLLPSRQGWSARLSERFIECQHALQRCIYTHRMPRVMLIRKDVQSFNLPAHLLYTITTSVLARKRHKQTQWHTLHPSKLYDVYAAARRSSSQAPDTKAPRHSV